MITHSPAVRARRGLSLFGVVAVFSLLSGASSAQSTNAPAPEPDEPAVQLNAFEVRSSRDYGYRATNSITATGIGTEIYKTPITVSVVTRDLINDLGGGFVRQALQFTAGVTTDSRDPGEIFTRGYIAPTQVNRLGGAVRNPVSEFIERIEIVKGPNSVFFGRVAPGGVVNLITLRPKAETETVVRATYGSYDYKTLTLDHNQALSEQLALRVAGAWHDRSDGFVDWTWRKQDALYGALTWRPTRKITLNLNADYVEGSENVSHSSPRTNAEYVRRGTSAQTAAQFVAANYPPNTPAFDSYAYEIASTRGRRLNNNGPEALKTDERRGMQGELLAEVTEWMTLRLAGAHADSEGTTLEISGFPDLGGLYRNQRGVFNGSEPEGTSLEAEAVFRFDLGPSNHRLLAGFRHSENENRSFSLSSNATNHNHFTDGPRRLRGSFPTLVPTTFTLSKGEERAYYLVDQIGLFDDRLRVLLGIRQTEVKQKAVTTTQQNLTQKDDTPQFGLVYEAVPGVVLFANASRTFEPTFSVDVFGVIAPNVLGKGREAGLKLDLKESVLSGAFTIYEVEREGEVRRDFLREIAEGRTPIFIPGGSSRSRGAELELAWTPARNYQAIAAYSYIWEAEVTKDTTSPFLVGRRLQMTPKHQFTFWNRYTFSSGRLKGAFIGGGARYNSEADTIILSSFDLKNESFLTFDAVLGYETKIADRPVRLQVNLRNLTDEDYHDGKWIPADPFSAYFTLEARF